MPAELAAGSAAGLALVEVTGEGGEILAPEWLARAEPVHRQLRERLPADYAGRLAAVFANGARMSLAAQGEAVRGVAVWRLVENTYEGRRLYIDDLVTDAAHRSQGVGKFLVAQLEARARALGCDVLTLDSGTQRSAAHRFYFREGFVIPSFCFRKTL
ncbi:GNAT family N-acetyltransferase [Sulfuritalea sp.]|uniref:GNAT family N-acetyltransferase n=1 Tax=Sulfuritalea sp. TaxID=2480090 RepID=UPI00286DD5CB|nr:GNAT family N-acetyltransferase [Sulfuritalea sp.]